MKLIKITALLLLLSPLAKAQGTPEAEAKNMVVNHYAKAYTLAMKYGDVRQAINSVYNVLAEYPTNDSLTFSLSYLYFQVKDYPAAVLTAQELLSRTPNHIGAIEISAIGYEQLGIKDKALDAYESLYMKSSDYQTLYKMAFLQYDLGRFKESNTNLDILLEKTESDTLKVYYATETKEQKEYPIKVALLNLKGLVSKGTGDPGTAKKYFQQALDIAPDFAIAKQNLADLAK